MIVFYVILKDKLIKTNKWILIHGNLIYQIILIHVIIYLNILGNIKSDTPLKFNRKFQANVPLPSSNIPFMPKFVCSK